jgi:hypothetical protein
MVLLLIRTWIEQALTLIDDDRLLFELRSVWHRSDDAETVF